MAAVLVDVVAIVAPPVFAINDTIVIVFLINIGFIILLIILGSNIMKSVRRSIYI